MESSRSRVPDGRDTSRPIHAFSAPSLRRSHSHSLVDSHSLAPMTNWKFFPARRMSRLRPWLVTSQVRVAITPRSPISVSRRPSDQRTVMPSSLDPSVRPPTWPPSRRFVVPRLVPGQMCLRSLPRCGSSSPPTSPDRRRTKLPTPPHYRHWRSWNWAWRPTGTVVQKIREHSVRF